MRLVAQSFDEIEHRVARRQLERVAARNEKGFAAGIALRTLGDGNERNFDAQAREHFARRGQLALAAVDQDEVRPRELLAFTFIFTVTVTGYERRHQTLRRVEANLAAFSRLLPWRLCKKPLETAFQNLTHHGEIVAGRKLGRADVEFAVLTFAKALGPGDDHGTDRIGTLNMAVVVNLDAARHCRQAESLGQLA